MGKQLVEVMKKADEIARTGLVHHGHEYGHILLAHSKLEDDERWALIRELVEEGYVPDPMIRDIPSEDPTIRTVLFDYTIGVLITEWRRRLVVAQTQHVTLTGDAHSGS